jgi:hypothetical protein
MFIAQANARFRSRVVLHPEWCRTAADLKESKQWSAGYRLQSPAIVIGPREFAFTLKWPLSD